MNKNLQIPIYNVLFEHPLFDYCDTKTKDFNILIAANPDQIKTFVQTVWYCAQMSEEYSFNFYLFDEKITQELNSFFDDAKNLVEPPHIETLDSNAKLDALLTEKQINYILSTNKDVNEQIKKSAANNTDLSRSIFTCNIDSNSDNYTILIDRPNKQKDEMTKFKVDDLMRFARNTDFAYSLSYSDTEPRKSIEEFVSQRKSNDSEKQTSYDSSLSAAVHIPYKLKIAGTFDIQNCQNKNALYILEHRRWMAYSYCQGWCMPTDDEIIEYAFKEGNNHKNNNEKFHPCMCRRNSGECQLTKYPELFDIVKDSLNKEKDEEKKAQLLWRENIKANMDAYFKKKNLTNPLSELDIASLQIHGIACKRITENKAYLDAIEDRMTCMVHDETDNKKAVLLNLKKRWEDLKSGDVERAISMFKQCMTNTKNVLLDNNDDLKNINDAAEMYIRINKKTDYSVFDNDMVDMLPFILNYDKKFQTAIIISDGKSLEDLMIPTMLIPEKAIFVLSEKLTDNQREKYKSIVRKYLLDRGNKTIPDFNTIPSFSANNLSNILGRLQCQNLKTPFIVNNSNDPEVPYGICKASEKLPIIFLSEKDNQLISIGNAYETTAVSGITSLKTNGYTVKEFIRLSGGKINNYIYQKAIFLSPEQHQNFRNLFEKTTRQTETGLSWHFMVSIFEKLLKKKTCKPQNDDKKHYTITCDALLFEQLHLLQDFRIIQDLKKENDSCTFACKNKGIIETFENYKDGLNEQFRFSPQSGEIATHPIKIKKRDLLDCKGENNSTIGELLDSENTLFQDLFIAGLIKETQDDEITIKFPELLKLQGKALEMVLYQRLKNTGIFSDLRTNVEVSWTALHSSFDERMKAELAKDDNSWGYDYYKKCLEAVKTNAYSPNENPDIFNEIDIVAVDQFTPIFFSCKNQKKLDKVWIYELLSITRHFNGKGILVINKSKEKISNDFLAKAKLNQIHLLTEEDIFNPDESDFLQTIKKILNTPIK